MCKQEAATTCFSEGFNCAQSVFSAFCEEFGLDTTTALKISCSFGAGMGRLAKTCGAVTGAYMVLGLKYGKFLKEDNQSKEINYAKVQEFSKRFTKMNGSIQCSELLEGYDISTPEGMEQAKNKGLFSSLCTKYVADAVGILEDMFNV